LVGDLEIAFGGWRTACKSPFRDRREYVPVGCRKNILLLRLPEKTFAIDPPWRLGAERVCAVALGGHELFGV